MHLTRRQKEILDYLSRHIARKGYAPTIEEIGDHFGLAPSPPSTSTSRTCRRRASSSAPGTAAARSSSCRTDMSACARSSCRSSAASRPARPSRPSSRRETIFVPEDMVGRGDTYVLQVKGDSMIDEQIRDGDYVIVEDRKSARDGEMVIALLEGENVTLKKLYRERGGKVRLQPANSRMKPICVDADDVRVQGVVIGVLRKY